MIDEEEISDVSLATFSLFDKENPGTSRARRYNKRFSRGLRLRTWLRRRGLQRLRRRSRLRRWRLQRLRRWRSRLQRLRRWLSRLWLWRLRRVRRLRWRDLGLGRRLLLVLGRLRASARLERLAITLTDASAMPGFDQVWPGQEVCLQRFPDNARVAPAKSGRVAANLSEALRRRNTGVRADDGALAAGDYALRVLS